MVDKSEPDGIAKRQHKREELVLPAMLRGAGGLRYSGGVIDLSVGGVGVRIDDEIPLDTELRVDIATLKFSAMGKVVRCDRVPDGSIVALKFNVQQDMITGRLLEYKVRLRSR